MPCKEHIVEKMGRPQGRSKLIMQENSPRVLCREFYFGLLHIPASVSSPHLFSLSGFSAPALGPQCVPLRLVGPPHCWLRHMCSD